MAKKATKSYIVREDILPEAILKTAQVKDMLTSGEALTVNEAVQKVGISRSAFYKYRDGVLPFERGDRDKAASIALVLEHRYGVLHSVLNAVAAAKGGVDSINQSMPVYNVSAVTINVNTASIKDVGAMIESLRNLEGVKKVEVVSHG